MSSASILRHQIETSLSPRFATSLRPVAPISRPLQTTGIDALDTLLGGGLPIGAVCEVFGPECSGRTSLALTFLSQVTRQGSACAWIDVADSLDPESAAACGIDLRRLLWVRCSENTGTKPRKKVWSRLDQALRAADLVLQAGGFAAVVFDMGAIPPEQALRVPLASWFRFRAAAERTQSTFLLLSQTSCAKSCSAVQLKLDRLRTQQEGGQIFTGLRFQAELIRDRVPRPSRPLLAKGRGFSAAWHQPAAWSANV